MTVKSFGGTKKQYCTPPALLEPVYELARGRVALDPCSHPDSIVKARTHIFQSLEGLNLTEFLQRNGGVVQRGDGLEMCWNRVGIVYVNPPFSEVVPWLQKAEEASWDGNEIVVLTNAATGDSWFHEYIYPKADSVCFFRGRKKYLGAKYSNPFGHLFSYWGPDPDSFRDIFRKYGSCW